MTLKRRLMEIRVSRGVRFLDRTLSRAGWLPNVDGENLDLGNGNKCMIGQLFPQSMRSLETNFARMINSGRLSKMQAKRCGFLLSAPGTGLIVCTRQNYEMLMDVWVDRMASLKKEARGT